MPRSDYLEILDEAEAAEPRGDVWDLDAECDRLELKLEDLPMDEKGWDRAVNVAYRRQALRAHPDKHPPEQRNEAEKSFKRLNESHKILLRVGAAVRKEAERGDANALIGEVRRAEVEAAALEKRNLSRKLASVMSLNGVRVSGGFDARAGLGTDPGQFFETETRTRLRLQKQMCFLLKRCGEEFERRARRRARRRAFRRLVGFGLGVAFLWFVRRNAPPEAGDAEQELRAIARGLRAAIRFMGAELASAVGRPGDGDEMADDLEKAFMEGRMRVNDEGGLEVLIPDDEKPGMFFTLNMSSGEDGRVSVWTEGADGSRVEVDSGGSELADGDPAPGVFGLPAERRCPSEGRGTVTVVEDAKREHGSRRRSREKNATVGEEKKKFRDWGWKRSRARG